MTITFTPATKQAAFARIALSGPAGSGKTYTGSRSRRRSRIGSPSSTPSAGRRRNMSA